MVSTGVSEAISFDDVSLGMTAKIQRVLQRLTTQNMASLAYVGEKDVELFESNKSLPCMTSLKLLYAYNTVIDTYMARVLS